MKHDLKNWEILSSNYLVKNKWCRLREDRVRLPNGIEIPNYYVLEYPDWINVIAVTKEQEFILIHQYRHGLRQYNYELPAGICEKTDFSPLETAKRELLEETGYGNGKWELFSVISANPGTHTNLCHCFLATDVEEIDCQHLDATEDIKIIRLNQQEIKQLLLDDEIKQSLHTAALWKYMAINGL